METEESQASDTPSNVYVLLHPIEYGKERIEQLELKPAGRHMRDFKLKLGADESIEFEPYRCAEQGLLLAGKPPTLADKMHPADLTGLAMVFMSFILPGPKTGKSASL